MRTLLLTLHRQAARVVRVGRRRHGRAGGLQLQSEGECRRLGFVRLSDVGIWHSERHLTIV